MSQHDSHENAKEFVVTFTTCHATSNHITNHKCEPEMQMRTLKNQCDICEMSNETFFSRLVSRLLMGFACTANIGNSMGTVWLFKTNSIPFMVDLVYILVQNSKVLIVYFVEINQQSDSFPLLTIIKTNKTKTLVYFLLNIFFSHKEIRY